MASYSLVPSMPLMRKGLKHLIPTSMVLRVLGAGIETSTDKADAPDDDAVEAESPVL
jgi:hypothetical protein